MSAQISRPLANLKVHSSNLRSSGLSGKKGQEPDERRVAETTASDGHRGTQLTRLFNESLAHFTSTDRHDLRVVQRFLIIGLALESWAGVLKLEEMNLELTASQTMLYEY